MAWRIALNPCDYLYYAYHDLMRRRRAIGNVTLMSMDVEGDIDPPRFASAVRRLADEHPILRSRVRDGLVTGRPSWRMARGGANADGAVFEYVDLRDRGDWNDRVRAECERRYSIDLNPREGPLVCLDYFAGPGGRGTVCLRWPHALMDAEGAQWLLSEVARCDPASASTRPAALGPDGTGTDPLDDTSLRERWRLFRRGLAAHSVYRGFRQQTLGDLATMRPALGLRARVFEPAERERIQANARRVCPPGSGIYARYLAVCVIRALHRIYTARGLDTDGYLITLPMSLRPAGPRPMHGNYLVSATLCGRREKASDARALAADLSQQVASFSADGLERANWALIRFAGLLRAWQYRLMLQMPGGLEPYASGFSYYGEIDPPIRSFLGARVTNLWGATPLSAPPGWNPAFARFGDRLNFTLTWIKGYIPDDLAEEYATHIEREALIGPQEESA